MDVVSGVLLIYCMSVVPVQLALWKSTVRVRGQLLTCGPRELKFMLRTSTVRVRASV